MGIESTLLAIQNTSRSRGRTTVAQRITRKASPSSAPSAVSRMVGVQQLVRQRVVTKPVVESDTAKVQAETAVIDSMLQKQDEAAKATPQPTPVSVDAVQTEYERFIEALKTGDMEAIASFGIVVQPIADAPDAGERRSRRDERRARRAGLVNPIAGVAESTTT